MKYIITLLLIVNLTILDSGNWILELDEGVFYLDREYINGELRIKTWGLDTCYYTQEINGELMQYDCE